MMEKIKNIYGAHPIPWTLGLLALFIGILVFTMLERMISFVTSVAEELMRRL